MSEPWLRTLNVDLKDKNATKEIEEESVHCVATSPPYKKKDGFLPSLLYYMGWHCQRVLAPGGRVFLNFGQLRENYESPFAARRELLGGAAAYENWRDCDKASKRWLRAGQTIAWVKTIALPQWKTEILELLEKDDELDVGLSKEALVTALKGILRGPGKVIQRGHYTPINMKSPTLNYGFEFVFTFWKPPESKLDRLALGVPFADKSNMKRGTRGKHGDLHCAGDVWFIPYRTTGKTKKKKHKHEFPEDLVERCLRVAKLDHGSTIMDPFFGSGTTFAVARRLGFNTWGIDIDPEAIEGARARFSDAPSQPRGKTKSRAERVRPTVYVLR